MEQPLPRHDSGRPQPSSPPAAANRALVIDLEGALLRSELPLEALFRDAGRVLGSFRAARLRRMGALEHVLADAELDCASLPYEPDVLNLALAARALGR